MNKWLFPLCILLAASLLFLAARNNTRRHKPFAIAVLDPAAALKNDPVANRIRLIGEKRNLLQTRMGAAAFSGSANKTPLAPIPASEKLRLQAGFSEHRDSFNNISGKRAEELLASTLGSARAEYERITEENYKKTLARLDEIFKQKQPPAAGALLDTKLRLFSLRLRYDALTRDKITYNWYKPETVKAEIDSLEKEIAETEKKSYDEFAKSQIGLTESARNEFLKTEKQRNEEFDKLMEKTLAETREQTRQAMKTYEQKINIAAAAATGERTRLLAGIEKRLFPAPSPPENSPAIQTALNKYEKNMDELLRKRITALAIDGGYDLVLSPPLYHSPAAPDLTGKF